MTASEIRQAFIDYFVGKGHTHVKSSSLVPEKDPTLIFTNAGMVQFKSVFLGEEKRDYIRAVTSQKCVRAGGKHNDLENVGRTARHHTFFEMLGNFSFGDYFKEDAVKYAWELLTEVYKLPKDKLWATVYNTDDEAYALWRDVIGVPESRIVRLGEKDNFWQMADTGPCGPCSEIMIDQGEDMSCGPDCGIGKCDCDRFLEVWNLVFMQFDRDVKGNLNPLPKPSIDTGMGLERISAVVQGRRNNYDSDLFTPIIHAIAEAAGVTYLEDPEKDVSLRVIADHLRAMTFLISEGVMPSNEGRGYVLRRIMRRAARHGKLLGLDKPFLYRLTGNVIDHMGGAYPELKDARDYVARLVLVEEERFIGTLEYGTRVLTEIMESAKSRGSATLPGDELFKLYDTYGFPMDLVNDIAEEQGFMLDMDGYASAMEAQKTKAKAAQATFGEERVREVYRRAVEKVGKTKFTGYETTEGAGKVVAIIKGDDLIDAVAEGDEAELILDATPFYAESGGQVGDKGVLGSDGVRFEVMDTVKPVAGLYVHKGRMHKGGVKVGDTVKAAVDGNLRKAIARNHTATHLLHAVLRYVLGDHVKQAGSLVTPDRLRFDFSHFAPLTQHERERVEELLNEKVLEGDPVGVEEMATENALKSGAMALFGEKYGDVVRVVRMGGFSTELCGGTHLGSTSDVGLFKLVSEAGVAAGVRRIEAVTGGGAYRLVREQEDELREVAAVVKSTDLKVADKVAKLNDQMKALEKELEKLKDKMAASGAGDLLSQARDINGVKVLASVVDGLEAKDLRTMGDNLREKMGSGILALGSSKDGRVSLLCMVSKDLLDRYKAGDIIKVAAAAVGGSGGGRPDMAQAGGKDPDKLPESMAAVYRFVEGK
ncbi:MAG: alanine--tRNA ligase [Nitrospirae bacterium]|nr:alanine--tRNA ligase [Nitrospirota bacterium]